MEAMLLLLALLIMVGVPDALHAIRLYRDIAASHCWIRAQDHDAQHESEPP